MEDLLLFEGGGRLSKGTTEIIQQEFNGRQPHDWMWSKRQIGHYDSVLCGRTSGGTLRRLDWLHADQVSPVSKSDRNYDPEYTHEVVQIHSPKHYPPPPFSATAEVRNAFGRVLANR
jgi:hypothetical protein